MLAVSASQPMAVLEPPVSIVHERRVTGGSIGVTADVTAAVKDERISSNSGVLCAPAVEQQGCCADRSIGIHGV